MKIAGPSANKITNLIDSEQVPWGKCEKKPKKGMK